MRKTSLFLLLLFALSSCHKQEPSGGDIPTPSHPTYEIGQYFHNDTLEGVVFFTTSGGAHGLMVGLDETRLQWCIDNYINEETGATNPSEGWNNTNLLMSNYDLRHYPAIAWSYEHNTWHHLHYAHYNIRASQWYVPAQRELFYLLKNHEAVSATLEAKGYPTLEDKSYWSSTETGTRSAGYGKATDIGEMDWNEDLKTKEHYVRVVRNF